MDYVDYVLNSINEPGGVIGSKSGDAPEVLYQECDTDQSMSWRV
jgi:hypothetical protein